MNQLNIFDDDNYNCSGSNQSFKCIKCSYISQKNINCFCSEEQLQWTAHRTNAGCHYHICEYCDCEDNKISQVTEINKESKIISLQN